MHAALGVHAGPKWKQVPAPPARHEKYALAPAWYTHVGTRQATSFGVGSGCPPAALPPPVPPFAVPPFAVPPFAVPPFDPLPAEPASAEPAPAGCFGSGGVPHPMVTTAATTNVSAWRTALL
jgi:hypothetical protein